MSGTFINSFSWPVGLDVVPFAYLHNQQTKTCLTLYSGFYAKVTG
ncbi:MAG: hypothetical protein ACJAZB_001757 [Psychrosphaera sp.]|jgi:hypothetical protein